VPVDKLIIPRASRNPSLGASRFTDFSESEDHLPEQEGAVLDVRSAAKERSIKTQHHLLFQVVFYSDTCK